MACPSSRLAKQGESIAYKPGMGVVPEINAPSVLPNLAGVAELDYEEAEEEDRIAPSYMYAA